MQIKTGAAIFSCDRASASWSMVELTRREPGRDTSMAAIAGVSRDMPAWISCCEIDEMSAQPI